MICALVVPLLLVATPAETPGGAPETVARHAELSAQTGRDAESQVKLALCCEAHGLAAERLQHLARAVMVDPANAAARGLLGLVADSGRWKRPEDMAKALRDDEARSALLADYAERRDRAPKTGDGHWKMALWCEEKGLEDEAKTHLTACVRLEPGRTAAWKRLGCKKVGGRWLNDDQIAAIKAEARARSDADKKYRPLLASWKAALRGRDEEKRFDAERSLGTLKDPLAAASVWRVFVMGADGKDDLVRAVQILGQLDAPLASRQLAMIALQADDADVRRAATETLARRDPRDFMGQVIAMLQDELRWDVRPVNGPGSAGILFVEGREFRRTRIYATPAPDFNYVDTGEPWATDAEGFAVLRIPGQDNVQSMKSTVASVTGGELRHGLKPGDARTSALGSALGHVDGNTANTLATGLFKPGMGDGKWFNDGDFRVDVTRTETVTRKTENEIPIGRILNEYRKSAIAAEAELEQDVAEVKRQNDAIKARNSRIADFLNNVSGQSLPADGPSWKTWWADQRGYAYEDPPAPPKAEFVEDVPLAYVPQPVAGFTTRVGPVSSTRTDFTAAPHLTQQGIDHARSIGLFADCFAAGTPVRTRLGVRPIESLEVGDSVLAQDATTGALGYKSVRAVYKFRPAETLKVTIGGETLLTTAVHRFWRAGEGWVMARDLKPGDPVRLLGGSAKVESVLPDVVRHVFNLEVADFSDYFVGQSAILAGDNTLQEERVKPFDAAVDR